MRRVVVTGMGVISPVGNSVEAFWESLLAGKCGIGPITRFDATEYKAKLAAEVKDFDPRIYMEKGDINKSDLYAQYAMAAAVQAVEQSGVIGTLQATEALKYILGIGDLLTGYLLTYDALTMTFRKIKIPRNPNCGICSDHPTITELIDYEQPTCDLRHH